MFREGAAAFLGLEKDFPEWTAADYKAALAKIGKCGDCHRILYVNLARTFSLRAFPSTRLPASLACVAFITTPICLADVTPVSASAAAMAASISASDGAAGI